MKRLCYLLSIVYCLSSCSTPNKDKTPVLGNLDSVAVAMDTTLQLGLESSYEFHKTLKVNDTLVYDVVGYGGSAAKGEYAILRRGADNKSDTVQKGKREGIIKDAVVTDVYDDPNEKVAKQIYLVMQQRTASDSGNVIGCFLGGSKTKELELNREFPPDLFDATQYEGHDTFYFAGRRLYREFPLFKKGEPLGLKAKITYSLIYADLQIEKIETIK